MLARAAPQPGWAKQDKPRLLPPRNGFCSRHRPALLAPHQLFARRCHRRPVQAARPLAVATPRSGPQRPDMPSRAPTHTSTRRAGSGTMADLIGRNDMRRPCTVGVGAKEGQAGAGAPVRARHGRPRRSGRSPRAPLPTAAHRLVGTDGAVRPMGRFDCEVVLAASAAVRRRPAAKRTVSLARARARVCVGWTVCVCALVRACDVGRGYFCVRPRARAWGRLSSCGPTRV